MEAITCLHGFSQRGDTWAETRRLIRRPLHWLAPDLRAAGMEELIAELTELWEREGIQRTHLVGYSQGARAALWLAVAGLPGRLLSLTAVSGHAGFEGAARRRRLAADRALAAAIEREGSDWFARHWAGLPIFASLRRRRPDLQEDLDRARRSHDPAHLAAVLRGLGGAARRPFWDRLDEITVPTLVVAGAEDIPYVEAGRRLQRLIPGSRLATVAESGHAVHLEQPQAFARLLEDHVSSR